MAELEVAVIEARGLKQKDMINKNNSFVQIYLVNKKSQKQKTNIIRKSNDPQWKETFVFDHLKEQDILYVDIYNNDLIQNEKLGSLKIDLRKLFKKGHMDNWFHIPAKVGLACYGQVHLILSYKQLQE